MSLIVVTGLSFLAGMIVERIQRWQVWMPLCAGFGFLIGTIAVLLGVK